MEESRGVSKNTNFSGVSAASTASAASIELPSSYQLAPGQIIGDRYEVKSVIGHGGMGCVYLVEQIFLHKVFALKTLHPGHMSDLAWRRFQKEAQATSAFDHAGLIKVYDFGMIGELQPFFVMDYFEGETLSSHIERSGALPLSDVLSIFIQVCSALAHAHKQGVVHRDIKPSNILIAKVNDEYQIKIVDFGIAKLTSAADSETLALTRTGEVFGTPYYMSPEQCLGTAIDHRADIYSLGCVLFQALTGMPPFIGDTALSIMMQHQSSEPVSLREASLGKTFPQAADAVLRKMLQKNPNERYQNVSEVATDLEAIRRGQRISHDISVSVPTATSKSRFPVQTVLACLASLGLLLVAFVIGRSSAVNSNASRRAAAESESSLRSQEGTASSAQRGSVEDVPSLQTTSVSTVKKGAGRTMNIKNSGGSGSDAKEENSPVAVALGMISVKDDAFSKDPAPPISVATNGITTAADSRYYSVIGDPKDLRNHGLRVFHFGEQSSPGIMIFPPSVDCLTAEVKKDGNKKVFARGDVVVSNFKPFTLMLSDEAGENPALLKRFRPDEVEGLNMVSIDNSVFSDKTLAACASLKSVKRIKIDLCRSVTDDSMQYLDQLPELQELVLNKTSVNGGGVGKLHRIKQLRLLDLGSLKDESGSSVLPYLSGSTAIEVLNLRRSSLDDSYAQYLSNLPNLQSLEVSSNGLTDVTIKKLQTLKHLEDLNVFSCPDITSKSFACLARFPALKMLTISYVREPDEFGSSTEDLMRMLGSRVKVKFEL
jgi:serine/threonine protein kinase